jgi:intraflagellar transport protein 81
MSFGRNIEEQVVTLLKSHLNLSFTLFQFSEISGRELLDLLNTVLHKISDTMPEKIGAEKIEATVERVSEFLRVLKYEFPVQPEEWDVRLGQSDRALIHPVLLFLLRDFEEMKKCAYLAKFTEDAQIPEEIRVDPTVAELVGQHRELREQFQEVHSEYEELGGTNVDELKATAADLETDKARLATRISAFKRKMQNVKNLEELLRWTAKLRQQSEREMRLNDQLQRLNDEKRLLLHRQQVASDRIKNMRNHMEQRLQALRNELSTLKNAGTSASSDDKSIVFAQQQVVAQTKRLEQKVRQLEELQKTRGEAEQQLQQRQKNGAIEVPSPTQFGIYVASLKTKNDNYRTLKSELDGHRRELAVMMRSEEIIRLQAENVQRHIAKVERQRGVTGARDKRRELEEVSAAKADLDDMKGKTLEEMTDIVREIQRSIQARQSELKPFVAQLQEQRKQKASVESKYLQAKTRYLNAKHEYEAASMELEEECKKLRTEIAALQSRFHVKSHELFVLERSVRRTKEEAKAQETGVAVSRDIKSYTDFFQKEARAMMKQTKDLKEQRKTLGSESDQNRKQLESFQSLRRLLQMKAQCQRATQLEKAKERERIEQESHMPGEMIDLTRDDAKLRDDK